MPAPSGPNPRDSRPENSGSAKTEIPSNAISLGGHAVHRAQSAAYVSRRIGELTRNGDLMVEKLISIIEAEAPTAATRQVQIAAIQVLYDRFIGKPAQTVDHTVGPSPTMDMARQLRQLSVDELRVAAKLDTPANPGNPDKPIIDVGEYKPDEPDLPPIPETTE